MISLLILGIKFLYGMIKILKVMGRFLSCGSAAGTKGGKGIAAAMPRIFVTFPYFCP